MGDGKSSSFRGQNIKYTGVVFLVILSLLTGCNSSFLQGQPTASATAEATANVTSSAVAATATPIPTSTIPEATVSFSVTLPATTDKSVPIYLDVLDEVTGLALNPARYQLQSSDAQHASITLPFRIGEVVKYRYVLGEKVPVTEFTSAGNQVRYRLIQVKAPMTVSDVVSGWTNSVNTPYTGKLAGTVTDATTKKPLDDIIVCAGGVQAYTASDGSFLIEGLPAGTHNVVAMSLDGTYQLFQQGAKVEENATTPAQISLTPAKMVSITFLVTLPQGVSGVPIRLAGDLISLGDTFADLEGGINTLASRMPVLVAQTDGRESITLRLPVGTDLHYKYTLGDGFWNAEHNSDGSFNLRELIVPDHDDLVQDSVTTWSTGSSASITFNLTTPDQTPSTDNISIQINPFAWTESLPMWSMGKNKWMYILYSPLNITSKMTYRYCRNDQCTVSGEANDSGSISSGRNLTITDQSQTLTDTVSRWANWQGKTSATTVPSVSISARNSDFVAGVEFQTSYQPSYQAYYLNTLQNLKSIGNRWVFLSPTWSYQNSSDPSLEMVPGTTPFANDLIDSIKQVTSLNMKAALYPQPLFPSTSDAWWQASTRDTAWWNTWFDNYEKFILNYADLAQTNNVSMLVLGGQWLAPALPDGKMSDGTSSGVPADAEARWEALLKDVHSHYSGKVYWALYYSGDQDPIPAFISKVDGVYLLMAEPLSNSDEPTEEELENHLSVILDNEIKALKTELSKPIILGAAYPSVQGSANDCVISTENTQCLAPQQIIVTGETYPVKSDLQTQTNIYNAFMVTVNARDWIDGFVSRGFYPPVTVQDDTASINGKPALDVLGYWFSNLTK